MQITGERRLFDDGAVRPVVWAHLQCKDLGPVAIPLLVDTGADRTVLSAHVFPYLNALTTTPSEILLTGIGGSAGYRLLQAALAFPQDDGRPVIVRGEFAIFTDLASSDQSVLGRDVLDNFSVMVDRPNNAVLLLAPNHRYRVETL